MDTNKTYYEEGFFLKEMKRGLIFHIPHASTKIPFRDTYFLSDEEIDGEILKLTDLETDKIFDIDGISKIVFDYNRLYCDVERLPDNQEEMYKYGRGFYYTKTDSGKPLRDERNKKLVEKIYNKHHAELTKIVKDKLESVGCAIIIDCHSFSNKPFDSDLDQSPYRPDICLGTDDYHTPDFLLNEVSKTFKSAGLNVKINTPYSGTIVPELYYKKNKNVYSIMIEVNRSLLYDNGLINMKKILGLNRLIEKMVK